ncbi:MAG: hypothetical protein J6X54_07460 [Treponema sp.]|nr:hypothetical protein [Treponema sp.]
MKAYKLNQIGEKRILGRNVKNAGKDSKPLSLFWAGSALEVNIKSTELWALISCDFDTHEPYVTVFVNGFKTMRFIPPKKKSEWICLVRNLNPQKENLITIMKDTQPMPGDFNHSLFIHQLGLSKEGKFCALKNRSLKLEFVGDSITTGEGMCGNPEEQDWIATWMSVSNNYAVQTAHNLNADFDIISQCGWGVVWGWDGNRNSNIPKYYEQICGVIGGKVQEKLGALEKFDFSKEEKDFVIINLGTNDNGAFFQPAWKDPETGIEYPLELENEKLSKKDADFINSKVKDFLKNVRRLNPKAKILWALGMMNIPLVTECIFNAVEEYKKESGDKKAYTLKLTAMEEAEKFEWQKGARGHPGAYVQKLAADKITEFIKNELYYERIKTVFKKIKDGKKVTVATLGGSITTGYASNPLEKNSWASLTSNWFKELCSKYNAPFDFINMGVSGTDSAFGAVRVDEHIIQKKADLVILEFAVNDLWLSPEVRKNSYEGILRKILANTDAAVFALFVNLKNYPYENNQVEQKKICDYYKIPYLSWKDSVFTENINADFEEFFEGQENVHPSNAGHKKISELLVKEFERIWKMMEEDKNDFSIINKALPVPLTKNQFEECSYFHNKNITPFENENWEAESPVHPEWEKRGGAVKGWQCSKNTGVLSFNVKGTSIGVTYSESDEFKDAQAWCVLKDGTETSKVTLNCYSEMRKGYLGWAYKELINFEEEETCVLKIAPLESLKEAYCNITGIICGAKSPVR